MKSLDELKKLRESMSKGEWESYDPGDGTSRLYANDAPMVRMIKFEDEIVGAYFEKPDGDAMAEAPEMIDMLIRVKEDLESISDEADSDIVRLKIKEILGYLV